MRLVPALLTSLALGLPGAAALAQDGAPPPPPAGQDGGGPPGAPGAGGGRPQRGGLMQQLSPEQQKTVWEMEAKHVSSNAGLNESETAQVVTTYEVTRENHNKAIAEIRAKAAESRARRGGGEGGAGEGAAGGAGGAGGGTGAGGAGGEGGRGAGAAMASEMQKAVAEATKTERASFETSLNAFLKPEQAAKVLEGLGNYDGQWDRLTWALAGLKLEGDTLTKAMNTPQTYTAAIIKARDITDPQARRTANTDARQKMQEEMKSILNEEQFGKFQQAAGPQAGGGRGGPGGRGGDGTGGAGGQGGGRGGGGAGGQGGGGGR